jgi:hypothetical protein
MFLLSAGMRAFTILNIVHVQNCSYITIWPTSLNIAITFTQRKIKVLGRLYTRTGTGISYILRYSYYYILNNTIFMYVNL